MNGTEFSTPCHYCGLPADSTDHVVPMSLIEAVRGSGDEALIEAVLERRRRMLVPCCHECNNLAGAVFDKTLEDRKRRIKEKLRKRYRKVLSLPDWSDSELMEISEHLRRYVIATRYDRDQVRKRIAW